MLAIQTSDTTQISESASKYNYVQQLANSLDADIFLFNGPLYDGTDELMRRIRAISQKRTNIALILTTDGGDPDAAYRLARFLKRKYTQLILYVFGFCKSAGTLLALAANRIVMSDFGELGPLDPQLPKEDEFHYNMESAVIPLYALSTINREACNTFQYCLDRLTANFSGISYKTAENLALSITTNVYSAIADKLEPMRLGENERSARVCQHYAQRLNSEVSEEALKNLVYNYPEHKTVIDYEEAQRMLHPICVAEPNELEQALEIYLNGIFSRTICPELLYKPYSKHIILKLPEELPFQDNCSITSDNNDANNGHA